MSVDSRPQAEDPFQGTSDAQPMEALACVSCRSRKLKCDRIAPACTRCVKFDSECVYPESRRKPAFKRKNVRELEARLAQVEDYLKEVNKGPAELSADATSLPDENCINLDFNHVQFRSDIECSEAEYQDPISIPSEPQVPPEFSSNTANFFGDGQLLDLGMSESLPPAEIIEELHNTFFRFHAQYVPVIHPGRYYQAFYSLPHRKPPICLQYAIWAMGALRHDTYGQYATVFYERARSYANADEMKASGDVFVSISHVQTWTLIATFEAKSILFTRSAMSSAKAVRLVHMLGLHNLDNPDAETPPCLGPVSGWAEEEERRRAFWGVVATDAHASISTGWPSLFKESDFNTRLPASDEAFKAGKKEQTPFLGEVFSGASYSGFACVIVVTHLFKALLSHVHFSKPSDQPENLTEGNFWKKHRDMDDKLSKLFMFMPKNFQLPQTIRDPTAIHLNLNLRACRICLEHAALDAIEQHKHPEAMRLDSARRLKSAAEEIAEIIKMGSRVTSVLHSPLSGLSLYVASTAYVYLAKYNPAEKLSPVDKENLESIFKAMGQISRVHEITRAFLYQACMDVERNDLASKIDVPHFSRFRTTLGVTCASIPLVALSAVSKSSVAYRDAQAARASSNGSAKMSKHRSNVPLRTANGPTDQTLNRVLSQERFQPMVEAITRNVAPWRHAENGSHKRKRMSPSPSITSNRPMDASISGHAEDVTIVGDSDILPGTRMFAHDLGDGGLFSAQMSLPDRTGSSPSSSANYRGVGTAATIATDTQSGSERTPPDLGLGNTTEENRIDLRFLQGRVNAPLWPEMSDNDYFGQQMTDTMLSDTFATGMDPPWGALAEDLDWNGMQYNNAN